MMAPNSKVFTENLGNKFVIMFSDMVRITGEGPYSFEAILYDNGNIILQYLNLNQPLHEYTVGIQNNDATDGLTIAHNESYLKDSLAVLISRHSWLSVEPAGGMIASNNFVDLQLTIRTSNFPFGEFYAAVQIESNDPDESLVVVPIHLTVGVTGLESIALNNLPSTIQLSPNYPNPFNPSTKITYSVKADNSLVSLSIFNLKGQKITTLVDEKKNSGQHSVTWNVEDLTSGIYLIKFTNNKSSVSSKCILIK
ncbi:MAG: T9SS type A sorting domain-containing protein [Candidatus Marinimicrobia bacterium]|nr:T9SS type A sorting domain-containing protein [Candidatus Neomarinimicrobiota bacterium]